jgi:hypothetical protein
MSSKRAPERIGELRQRLLDGMAAFSSYGFPESHAISFAYLVYASAWLKHYYPAAFTAALLRNQPMGFYAPTTLITDARHTGSRFRLRRRAGAADVPVLCRIRLCRIQTWSAVGQDEAACGYSALTSTLRR